MEKYTIVDLTLNREIGTYGGQFETVDAWAANCSRTFGQLDFAQLNVSGLETETVLVLRQRPSTFFGYDVWGTRTESIEKRKRYQVVGAAGKPVDIRTWTTAIAQFEALRWKVLTSDYEKARTLVPWLSLLEEPCHTGKKEPVRKWHEPAMYRQNLMLGETEPADEVAVPVGRSNRRVRSTIWSSSFDRPSRSWKDQSKARKQWAKNLKGAEVQPKFCSEDIYAPCDLVDIELYSDYGEPVDIEADEFYDDYMPSTISA